MVALGKDTGESGQLGGEQSSRSLMRVSRRLSPIKHTGGKAERRDRSESDKFWFWNKQDTGILTYLEEFFPISEVGDYRICTEVVFFNDFIYLKR